MKRLITKHPQVVRWSHWINVPLLSLMIWSGVLIYWANDVYRLGWGETTLVKFFPEGFYRAFNLDHRLAEGMAWHFLIMWLFALNGLVYVSYLFLSGEWRELAPGRRALQDAFQVVLHDLGIRKDPLPEAKFNAAQQIAYTGVICMGALSLVTGLAIYKPVQFAWLTGLLGGYEWARLEHFALTCGYVLFVGVHLAQVIRAGWRNFLAMVTGQEVITIDPATCGDTSHARHADAAPIA